MIYSLESCLVSTKDFHDINEFKTSQFLLWNTWYPVIEHEYVTCPHRTREPRGAVLQCFKCDNAIETVNFYDVNDVKTSDQFCS